jgi:hypothetical protein
VAGETAIGSAAAEQNLAVAHASLLRAHDLQFTFDRAVPPDLGWLKGLLAFLRKLGPLAHWAFWGLLAVVALLILWLILREFVTLPWGGKRKKARPLALQPDAGQAAALLEDADRLAAEQRFAEAVRALLFRSVDDINRRRPGAVKPAFTGRDISRLTAIPDEPRDAFSRIAHVVERSLFGGREVDAAAFQLCRRDYETFAFSEAWR